MGDGTAHIKLVADEFDEKFDFDFDLYNKDKESKMKREKIFFWYLYYLILAQPSWLKFRDSSQKMGLPVVTIRNNQKNRKRRRKMLQLLISKVIR